MYKQILTLPTWLLVQMLKPFLPQSHILKQPRFTLACWAANSTPLNDAFSALFWFCISGLAIAALIIF